MPAGVAIRVVRGGSTGQELAKLPNTFQAGDDALGQAATNEDAGSDLPAAGPEFLEERVVLGAAIDDGDIAEIALSVQCRQHLLADAYLIASELRIPSQLKGEAGVGGDQMNGRGDGSLADSKFADARLAGEGERGEHLLKEVLVRRLRPKRNAVLVFPAGIL